MGKTQPYRLIISGGGTGGHIFPAVAIANEFRSRYPNAEILFVGAEGKMEMTRVPEAGYKIIGLWISGLQRKLTLSNLLFPLKLIVSYFRARKIVSQFKPHVVIGTGGYASGPIMIAATRKGIPTVIQEQNSFAGLTNKQVADKASKVCVAYEGMEKYFPAKKIVVTGNPIRKDILNIDSKREQALTHFAFSPQYKTILIIGGSLGARTINESVINGIEKLLEAQVQVIWQTGKGYYDAYKSRLAQFDLRKIRVQDFLREMDLAYAAADVIISRSGALSVSEICVAKKPVILVPSPNVAEDHQTKNARALTQRDAAVMVLDKDANATLIDTALNLVFDASRSAKLRENIALLAKPDATSDIVNEIEKLLDEKSVEGNMQSYKLSSNDSDTLGKNAGTLQTVLVRNRYQNNT
jgi:UDP-N-acetylglucosamine--N-acetylmuramyl-(pentapeptide) pyrophosphoryl-undecaprenol N-acetylglucosamine transferase